MDRGPNGVEASFFDQSHHAMATGGPVSIEEYFVPLDEWFEVRAFPDETGLFIYFRETTNYDATRFDAYGRATVEGSG